MKTTTPTIETLVSKSKGELRAMFRQAAEAAGNTTLSAPERSAARKTADTVRRCLGPKPGP